MPDRQSQHTRKTTIVPGSGPPDEPPAPVHPAAEWEDARAHAGRPDQGVKHTTGPGAGGATEWGGGNARHPSRIKGKPPGH